MIMQMNIPSDLRISARNGVLLIAVLLFCGAPRGVRAQRSGLDAEVRAVGVEHGKESNVVQIKIEEFKNTNFHPLLPFIFFGENAADIPDRYIRFGSPAACDTFHEDSLYALKTVETYHHILNIIGERMRKHRATSVVLVGCNNNLATEGENLDLSMRRALAVQKYLHEIWGIAVERMSVTKQNLPDTASSNLDADGQAENRRVEIRATDDDSRRDILSSVRTTEITRTSTPPIVRFYMRASGQILGWSLVVSQRGLTQPLKKFPGARKPPLYPDHKDWDLQGEQSTMPRTDRPLEFQLKLSGVNGETASSRVNTIAVRYDSLSHKIRQHLKDTVYKNFSLILFGFDRSSLDTANKRMLAAIQKEVADAFSITITGYADRTGEPEHNITLSQERAVATRDFLRVNDHATIVAKGFSPKYPNDNPEGRFYCRTVEIEAKILRELTDED